MRPASSCSVWGGGICQEPATHVLVSDDGQDCGLMCEVHGQSVIGEYREKLGEEWTLRPLPAACLPLEPRND